MFTDNAFLVAGLTCLIAALVGGGLNAFGIEIPVLESRFHQIGVGILGLILIALAFELESVPRRKPLENHEAQKEVSLELRSTPDHADIFLDWVAKGQTPVRLEGRPITGLLVMMKDGYQPQFRSIYYAESTSLPEITLVPEPPRLRTRLLLLAAEGASGESIATLVTRLGEEGFTTIGDPEVKEFQQALLQAGGLSHPALRAWARAKFHTDLLVTARVRQSTSKISEQDFGRLDIQKALHGVEQAEVHIALDVQDMHSGDHVIVVTGKGKAFTLDRAQSTLKALTEAVTEAVQKLRLWAHG
jgi:hypothetical protein